MSDPPAPLFTDLEGAPIWSVARLAWVLCVGGLVIGSLAYVKTARIGPRTFWATDACADPAVVCGTMPLALLPATLGGLVLIVGGLSVIGLAEQRYSTYGEVPEDA